MLFIRSLFYTYLVILLIVEGSFYIGVSIAPETLLFVLIVYCIIGFTSIKHINLLGLAKDHKWMIILLTVFFVLNLLSVLKNGGVGYNILHFLLWPANFLVVLLLAEDNRQLLALITILIIVAAVRCTLYLCHVNPWIVLHEVSSMESYRNPFAYSLILPFVFVSIVFVYSKSLVRNLFWLSLLVLFLFTLLDTLSRGSYFSIILTLCGMSIFFFLQSKRIKYKVFAPFAIMAIFFVGILSAPEYLVRFKSMYRIDIPSSLVYRYNIYRTSVNMAISNPFLGVGPGRFAYAVPEYATNPDVLSPDVALRQKSLTDSDFSQILAETGFVGLLVVAAILMVILAKYTALIRKVRDYEMRTQTLVMAMFFGFVSYIMNMAFDNTLTSSLGWFLLGIYYVGSCEVIYQTTKATSTGHSP